MGKAAITGRLRRVARLAARAPFHPGARAELSTIAERARAAAGRSRAARLLSSGREAAGMLTSGDLPFAGRASLLGAHLARRRGNETAALEAAGRLGQDYPGSGEGPALRAEILRRRGEIADAERAAADAFIRSPRSVRVAKIAGIVALAAGDFASAVERLQVAVKGTPRDSAVRYNLARALLTAGRPDEALEHISVAVARAPDNSSYIEILAHALRRVGHPEKVVEILERKHGSLPQSATAVETFAAALFDVGREDEARALVRGRLGRDADRWLARVAIRLKRYEEALPHANEAVAVDPSNPWNHYMRFIALKGLGDLSQALEALQRARSLGGDPRFETQHAQLTGLMRTLSGSWAPEVPGPPERLQASAPNLVLHLLERTMPHRQSGYTVRSLYTMKAQREAGLDPRVATRLGFPLIDGVRSYQPVEDVEGVPHHRLMLAGETNYARYPKDEYLEHYVAQAAALVREVRPAVLQPASSYFNALVGLGLKHHFDIPMVYEVRGFQEDSWASRRDDARGTEFYEGRIAAENQCMLAADRIVTLAEVMKEEIASRGVDPERIHVIPNAVDTDRFGPQSRNEALAHRLGIGDRVVIGYITSLSSYEGVDDLLRGIAVLVARGLPVLGLVVGDGTEFGPLKVLAEELGLAEHVRLTGRVPHEEVLDYYSLIDVFCVPRKNLRVCRLVTPLKPFEAMAVGLPLLVSDVAALREIAAPGERGLAFTPEDPESLADQAAVLIADPEMRRRFGSAGREWVCRERTWASNAERYRVLYEGLLAERGFALPEATTDLPV